MSGALLPMPPAPCYAVTLNLTHFLLKRHSLKVYKRVTRQLDAVTPAPDGGQ
jgi:hypothetical protein